MKNNIQELNELDKQVNSESDNKEPIKFEFNLLDVNTFYLAKKEFEQLAIMNGMINNAKIYEDAKNLMLENMKIGAIERIIIEKIISILPAINPNAFNFNPKGVIKK